MIDVQGGKFTMGATAEQGDEAQDWYASYSSEAQTNPKGPDSGSFHVYRGGAWNVVARGCRVSIRADIRPTSPVNHIGLRLAL
ncbi:MAG: SUMF1/EgtB/PvdO family nonheme iron enzyme [Muribaculaceae bacterium]|nr:SUMF1/EgtB/PvdO family nonheme iron enzyme [Muribaculaceae bacterium]